MEASTTTLILLLLLAMSTSNVSNDDVNKLMETITDNNIGKLSWENIQSVEKETIIELLRNEDATDHWPLEKIRDPVYQQASFWICVLEVIDADVQMTLKYNIPKIMENLLFFCGHVSSFIRKVKGLQSKMIKKQDISLLTHIIIDIPKETNLGTECKKYKITEEWLENPKEINIENVSRRLMLELRLYKLRNNICYKKCALWIKYLCKLDDIPNIGNLRRNWEKMNSKKLSKKTTETYQEYLSGNYVPPTLNSKHICNVAEKNQKTKRDLHQKNLKRASSNQDHVYLSMRKEAFMSRYKLYLVQNENKKLHTKLEQKNHKRGILLARNVNKRIKRKDIIITSLQKETVKLQNKLALTHTKAKEIKQKYKNQSALLRYYKNLKQKETNTFEKNSTMQTKTNDVEDFLSEKQILKEKVIWLENENEELSEKVNELMNNKEIITFQGGKYTDTIREVYASLLASNVGVKNVEKVVKIVLNKLANVKVDRLPKKTFSEIMLVEAKALAQMQCAEAIMQSDNVCTLHTDGTKRDGREFGGVQIGTESGQYSLGIMEILQGNTDSFFNMIKNMFHDLAVLADNSETEKNVSIIISKIKNMMTDRHVVNDSLKLLLEKWRNDCLPLIIDNFKSIPKEIQAKLGEINHFKCNLHVLVNLGTQAENALKLWEKSVVIAESSSNFIKGSYNFSTNAPDFIRASTKLCVPGADQKSGYGLLFKSYLDSLNPPVTLEMSTFHGHRINVLFSMGAAVFYHRHHISDFINSYFLNSIGQNNLVTCVSNYLNNNVYIAGCRALGIVDKLLTGPLWRQIESTKHILDLNQVWYTCLNNLQIFSEDSSELLEGNSIYPNFTNNNHIYDALFNVDDEELNMLTIEALQILCTNFLIIIHRQLGDYLPGGKFHQDSANFSELKKQSSCVASTNIVSERDFTNFDRLRREKPNANTIALEGIILFSNNKTLKWLDDMDGEKKSKIIETARLAAPKIIEDFRKRKTELKLKRIELVKQKKEDILKIQRQKNEEICKLNSEIQSFGGIWETINDITINMKILNNNQKFDALKCQIKYRKVVLKESPKEKQWFQFSANNKLFSFDEILDNLKKHLTNNVKIASESSEHFGRIKNKTEHDTFMINQRAVILDKIKQIQVKYNSKTFDTENRDNMTASVSNPKKKRQNKCNSENSYNHTEKVILHKFIIGQTVAVAYSDAWYPGQVLQTVGEDKASVKFLHPCSEHSDIFQWPHKDDISIIENLFVFSANFDINPRDRMGRTWSIQDISELRTKYEDFCALYFE